MHVRLIRHWNGWAPGREFDSMPDGQANLLIRRGTAEAVSVDSDPIETASRPGRKPSRKQMDTERRRSARRQQSTQ
jgi:hypothetical protein